MRKNAVKWIINHFILHAELKMQKEKKSTLIAQKYIIHSYYF